MKILLIFTSSNIGGTEASLTRMALNKKAKVDYQLSSFGIEGPWSKWVRAKGHKPIIFGERNDLLSGTLLGASINLYKLLISNNYSAIYVCGTKVSLCVKIIKILLPKIKIIHAIRWNPNQNNLLDIFFTFTEKFTKFLVAHWITNSLTQKNTLIKRCKINPENISVIHNGINIPNLVFQKKQNEIIKILTVANITKRKGYLEYLSIIKNLSNKHKNLFFTFIGRDESRGALQNKIKELGLSEIVSYQGYIKNVEDFYNDSDIFVLPSLYGEGCPTVILEAFSFSLPVVAYNIDGNHELIDNLEDGLLVKLNQNVKFEEAIEKLASNIHFRTQMGSKGYIKIKNNFTLDSCTFKHDNKIREIIVGI